MQSQCFRRCDSVALGAGERLDNQHAPMIIHRVMKALSAFGRRDGAFADHSRRQMIESKLRAVAQHDAALDHIGQLANVAGPRIGAQLTERFLGETGKMFFRFRGKALEKKIRQRGDILYPIAQGRQRNRDYIESMIQIFAERAASYRVIEILVGRRDNFDIDPDRLGAADPFKLPLLEKAQEFGLQLRGNIADLIEEDGAAVPRAPAGRPTSFATCAR